MAENFQSICNLSSYSLLSSCLSLDDIINNAIKNNHEHAILTDTNLFGSMEFYHKCKVKNIKPIVGLIFNHDDGEYLIIAKNNDGFQEIIKLNSLQTLQKEYEPEKILTSNCFVIHLSGKFSIKNANTYDMKEFAIIKACCLSKDDQIVINALDAIKNERKLNEYNNNESVINYILSNEEASKIFTNTQIKANSDLLQQCNWELPGFKQKLAIFKVPDGYTQESYLKQLCLEGLKQKVAVNGNVDKSYVDRLMYELDVIHNMGYDNYFLIVSDFVKFAKSKDIRIGPGRGSAAGSLVSYCLDITEIDPIKYGLIFERFLNSSRKSLPDIDIDVMDTRRQELIDYIFSKYGADNTSYIMTLQKIKAKMAIRDIGRILDIDLKIIDKITKVITPEEEEDLNKCKENKNLKIALKEHPLLFELAKKIINIPRQVSTHAAGIIIADQPLYNYIPVQLGIDQWHLSALTMDYLESLGLFKMDILGLKNLSIISDVLEKIWIQQGKRVDIKNIDLDDPNVYDELCKGNTIGVFQLESNGMRNTVMKIKPRCLEDISICSALFRPGPQALIPDFVKTREGKLEPKYLNDIIKPTFEPTLGFCIYQEQVIELIRSVTNFSLAEADIFRRAISKKKEELFEQMRDDFFNAAVKNNYSEVDANDIYNFILEFANYGFNHSHSLAYSMISYQMAFLKYYYPLEFYATLLEHGDSSKNSLYISQVKQNKINIKNVSISKSKSSFSIEDGGILFGLGNIKGIGSEASKKILEVREQYSFTKWDETISVLSRQGVNKRTIELLIKAGAFDEFGKDRNFMIHNYDEIVNKSNIYIDGAQLFDFNLDNDYEPLTEKEKEEFEYELLGYTFSNNEWANMFEKYKEQYDLKSSSETDSSNENYLIKIKKLKKTVTKFNKDMCFIEFSEHDVNYRCASFSETIFNNLEVNKYAVVKLKGIGTEKVQLLSVVSILETN